MSLIENTNYVKIGDLLTIQSFEAGIDNIRKIFNRVAALVESARLAAAGENIGETGASGSSLDDLLRGAIAVLNMQIDVNNKTSELLSLQATVATNVATIANLNADILALDNDITTLNADIATLNTNITTVTNILNRYNTHHPLGWLVQSGTASIWDMIVYDNLTAGVDELNIQVTRSSGSGTISAVDHTGSTTAVLTNVVNGTSSFRAINQPTQGWWGQDYWRYGVVVSGGTWTGTITGGFKNTYAAETLYGSAINYTG